MNRWTADETDLLKTVYPTGSKKEIIPHFPNRNWRSIRYRAKKLGLNIGHNRDDYWPREQIDFLKENYENMIDRDIGKKLNRSPQAIQSKRTELGLSKNKYNDFYTPSLPDLTETEKAYLAGLLDADGSISLHKCHVRQVDQISPIISFAVSITSANKAFCDEVNRMIGGTSKRRSDVHYETVVNRQADILYLLQRLLPYLRLKRKQAEVMIEFCKDRLESRRRFGSNTSYSDKSFKFVDTIKEMNTVKMEDRKWM